MSLLTRQRVLLAKVEGTAGTAESLADADGAFNIYSEGPIITNETGVSERPGQSTFSRLQSIPTGYTGRARFSTDLVGKGASGVPDWASTFLVACGMVATGSSYAFVTGSATAKTLTIAEYVDGVVRKLAGCVGTFEIELNAGQHGRINFDFIGVYQTDADAALPTPNYPAILPPRFANTSAVTFDSQTPVIASARFAAGNVLKLREDASKTAGFIAGIITDRIPTFALDPELTVVATKNWLTSFTASTAASLACVVGTASNNIITITMPKAQITTAPGRADRDGVAVTTLEGIATRNADAGDDEMTIAFT